MSTVWPRRMLPATNRVTALFALARRWLAVPEVILPYTYFLRGPSGAHPWAQHTCYLKPLGFNATQTRLRCRDIHTGKEDVWLALFVYTPSGPRWQRVGNGERAPRVDDGCSWDCVDLSAPGVGCPLSIDHVHLVPVARGIPPQAPNVKWERERCIEEDSEATIQ